MAPCSSSSSHDHSMASSSSPPMKAVHFDSDCVLIPCAKNQGRVSSRTFSLPLWRSSGDKEPAQLTIRVPSFGSPRPRLHSRDKLPSPSCLVRPGSPHGQHHLHPRERSDPCISPTAELAVTHSDARRGRSMSGSDVPVMVVPLRACCAECFESVDAALRTEYEEKWTRGARRRRRSSSSASDCAMLGGRLSIDLVRVDELPTPSALDDQEESDDCHLFPLPCGKRKKSPDTTPSASEDEQPGCITPPSLEEQASLSLPSGFSTPSLTPTSDSDELPLPSPPLTARVAPAPLVIPVHKTPVEPMPVPIIKEPHSPPSSPSSSPVRTRILHASAAILRAAAAPTGAPGLRY
ncbi:hypothetical protein AURDEDRAFT_179366 [Auricularia subglabra TFB-10046 SS5]|nr:hypothetical protein AURDEDRAFT_179366 [Auricularia subglabra TFB-10046 SS5]